MPNKYRAIPPYSSKKTTSGVPEEYTSWSKSQTPENLDKLLIKMSPTIDQTLKSYGTEGLGTKAKTMAVAAFKTFDPKKGMALGTYLHQQLQALQRERAKRSNTVHIPENVLLQKNKLYRAGKTFESEYDREPTVMELSDITGIPRAAVERARKYRGTIPASATQSESGDDLFARTRDYDKVWADYVYFDLDPMDKRLFEMTTGYAGSTIYPKGDIARKLKISPSAVSQRINGIIAKLEEVPSAS